MKIVVIGTQYVGLVSGACFAAGGNEVTCVDEDEARVEQLSQGDLPLYEPGLAEMTIRNASAGRLHFTAKLDEPIKTAHVVFLAVATPVAADGSADLSALWRAVDQLAPRLSHEAIVVVRNTVPVGTATEVAARLRQKTGRDHDVASNPDFLQEGSAVHDFLHPDRVIVGVDRPQVAEVLRALYTPFLGADQPLLVMTRESAEMTKYVVNAMLTTRISFINEMAHLCEQLDADIQDVRRGIGHDHRIGFSCLVPGIGYGGGGLPTDIRVLARLAREVGVEPRILDAVVAVNQAQQHVMIDKIREHFQGQLAGKVFGVWGVSFKPYTDDIRETPARVLIDYLLDAEARVHVHDPEAMANLREIYGERLLYGPHPMDVLVGVDALVINTPWGEFRHPDFVEMRRRMSAPIIFDGRNLYDPGRMATAGFTYYSVGRKTTRPD